MINFNGRTHAGFALLIWILVCFIDTGYGNELFFNPIPFIIGSLFPDTDIRLSLIGKFIPLWLFFNHRGFTHTIPAMVLFSAPIAFWSLEWSLAFAGGYLLHLLMDDSTPMSIKWWRGHKKRAVH